MEGLRREAQARKKGKTGPLELHTHHPAEEEGGEEGGREGGRKAGGGGGGGGAAVLPLDFGAGK